MKVALVTTAKDADPYLNSFIKYHFSLGIDHIFLFLDDPNDKFIMSLKHTSRLSLIKNDDVLQSEWQQIKSYKHFKKFVDSEVMARQILNVNIAIRLSKEMNIDWLLNIDADELFYLEGESLHEHFTKLDSAKIDSISYHNHEAIPSSMNIENFFLEVNLFKKNFSLLNPTQRDVLNKNLVRGITYFNYYWNGKSAAKISKDIISRSCHVFSHKPNLLKKLNPFVKYANVKSSSVFPCILHYPSCGFDFYYRKYKLLGDFDNKWFRKGADIKDILPFHVESRDIFQNGTEKDLRRFYKQKYIDDQYKNYDLFMKEGIYFELSVNI
jgi:hypothetical protein